VLIWPLGLLSIILPLVILTLGVGKEKEAESQLVQVLEAGVISTSATNRLDTYDLYWSQSIRIGFVWEDIPGAKQGNAEDNTTDSQVGTAKPGGRLEGEGNHPSQ
jgi:hypothetical protein